MFPALLVVKRVDVSEKKYISIEFFPLPLRVTVWKPSGVAGRAGGDPISAPSLSESLSAPAMRVSSL
jgi:hypothetical protein